MAESNPPSEEVRAKEEGQLKYLEFVKVAAAQAVMWVSSLYEFAMVNAGPLRPGVQTVEGTVRGVIGPVYDKLHDVPLELLRFLDRKVDRSVRELELHVPSLVKEASSQAYAAAQKAPAVARSVAGEVQRSGVVATAGAIACAAYDKYGPVAKDLYARCEPAVEQYAVATWRSLNRLPLFPQVAQVLVPTAAYWSNKYNRTVCYAAERRFPAAGYLPTIPVERIAKVFGDDAHEPSGNVHSSPPPEPSTAD